MSQIGEEIRRVREVLGWSLDELAMEFGVSTRTVGRWERGETAPKRMVLHLLRDMAGNRDRPVREVSPEWNGAGSPPTFIDLFAGIGGTRLGLERAGARCVFTSEWDKFARITYAANFEVEHAIRGDITELPTDEIPEHDILIGGFPCQPFSIAGVSKKASLGRSHGFACETQGTLFFDIARILEKRRPAAFLLENVKNLLSHDKGRTFEVIRRTLEEELEYSVSWRVIDARHWVPQHRERVFIVGFRDGWKFPWDAVEIPEASPRIGSILHPEDGTEASEAPYTLQDSGRVNPKYTLSDKLWGYLQEYAERHRKRGNGFGFGLVGPDDVARTLSARYYKDGSEILVRQEGTNPRRLTPRECARLMGFDRPTGAEFRIEVSDTQAYKQFGNSVVVPVVEAIAKPLIHVLADPERATELQQPRSRQLAFELNR